MGTMRHAFHCFPVVCLLLACNGAPPLADHSLAERTQALADVFETPMVYTVRRLDSLEMERFFRNEPTLAADSAGIRAFYQRRGYQYAWFVNDTLAQAVSGFLDLVQNADTTHREVRALRDRLQGLLNNGGDPGTRPEAGVSSDLELRLTALFFRFAEGKYGGLVGRDLRELDWFIPRRKKDMGRLLDSLTAGSSDLSLLEPLHPQYGRLKAHLRQYRDLDTMPWPAIGIGELRKLEPGAVHAAVPLIRERLILLGDHPSLPTAAPTDENLYDSTLVLAVQRFQQRHGLHADAVLGPGSLNALNVTPAERLRTLLVNMERLRWVPEQSAPDLLLVNIPEFKLHVYENGEQVLEMDVVVGKAATRTVIFSDTLTTVVFSPTWTVPPGIMRTEVLPGMRKDPDYLRKKHMEIVGGTAANPIVRQKPGTHNALGLVKFLFPNNYHIYMHDTPSKNLFGREQRAFSHGCIRVSKPLELAEFLLKDQPEWTADRIKKAMNAGRETHVRVLRPRPVTIGYFTAWVDANGVLNFRDDVYGHDARLAHELFGLKDTVVAL